MSKNSEAVYKSYSALVAVLKVVLDFVAVQWKK